MGAVAVQTIRALHEFLVERDPKGSAGAVSFFFENKGWGRLGGRGRQDGAVSRAIARVRSGGPLAVGHLPIEARGWREYRPPSPRSGKVFVFERVLSNLTVL